MSPNINRPRRIICREVMQIGRRNRKFRQLFLVLASVEQTKSMATTSEMIMAKEYVATVFYLFFCYTRCEHAICRCWYFMRKSLQFQSPAKLIMIMKQSFLEIIMHLCQTDFWIGFDSINSGKCKRLLKGKHIQFFISNPLNINIING